MASSSSKTELKKMLILTSDKDEFEIDESVMVQFETIQKMVEGDFTLIPLPNVDTETLIKVIEYMKKHAEKTNSNEEAIKKFEKEFMNKNINEQNKLVLVTHYAHIISLTNLLNPTIVDRVEDKTDPEAIRKIFNVTCDFDIPTLDEEIKFIEGILSGKMKMKKII
ncbi:hypothetical protein CQW23_27707 [Capsicum baccatum]|uniref:SKP1-like protein n=1 Tax=Capsicum baccatum TaxID=33114 RepID=A0A2G2VEF7_CAPBA|nr:hypothetical protein CQW23_27707 [Capsicum baccatum]